MNKNKNSGIQSTRAFFSKEKLQRLTKKLQRLTTCPAFFRNYEEDEITSPPAIIIIMTTSYKKYPNTSPLTTPIISTSSFLLFLPIHPFHNHHHYSFIQLSTFPTPYPLYYYHFHLQSFIPITPYPPPCHLQFPQIYNLQ